MCVCVCVWRVWFFGFDSIKAGDSRGLRGSDFSAILVIKVALKL